MHRTILGFISLFYLQFWVPLSLIIYTPIWNNYALKQYSRINKAGGIKVIQQYDRELRAFFRHQGKLTGVKWSEKDKNHLTEVRGIYDLLFIIFPFMLLAAFYSSANKEHIRKSALLIFIAITLLMLIMPFFKSFWKNFFHPLLFNNNLWKMKREDMCFYLFPKKYFRATIIFMIIHSLLTNTLLLVKNRKNIRSAR